MIYNEWGKFWVNESVDAYDYKIEYLKFEEGTCFPEILSKQPHVAYKVDDLEKYIDLFGTHPKYGLSGRPIASVTYRPQPYRRTVPLYELT